MLLIWKVQTLNLPYKEDIELRVLMLQGFCKIPYTCGLTKLIQQDNEQYIFGSHTSHSSLAVILFITFFFLTTIFLGPQEILHLSRLFLVQSLDSVVSNSQKKLDQDGCSYIYSVGMSLAVSQLEP